MLAVNALPLIGVFQFGWNVATLVLLYWFETGIVGFWTCVRVAFGNAGLRPAGVLAALFILVHAGLFMCVHLLFLEILLPLDHASFGFNQVPFLFDFLATTRGVWLPLGGFFIIRGLIAYDDWRVRRDINGAVSGFYVRIFVMQGTILLGALLSTVWHSGLLLVILIVLKTSADLFAGPLSSKVSLTGARQ